jgi:hypothetical protein
MHRSIWFVLGLSALVISNPAAALGLGEAGELEHARANARAGGPISGRDAELLERYGCLSGTDSAFCRRLSHRRWHHTHRGRVHR